MFMKTFILLRSGSAGVVGPCIDPEGGRGLGPPWKIPKSSGAIISLSAKKKVFHWWADGGLLRILMQHSLRSIKYCD